MSQFGTVIYRAPDGTTQPATVSRRHAASVMSLTLGDGTELSKIVHVDPASTDEGWYEDGSGTTA